MFVLACGFLLALVNQLSVVVAEDEPPPLELMPSTDLAKKYGFELEVFEVKTSDGYILSLQHIKSKNATGPAVFLQHGLLMSSDVFLLRPYSLAYALSANGNDVWLGNARGNVNSRKHEKYTPDEEKFWDFSWHDMGLKDLPAEIDFILSKTKSPNLYLIGHSMGATMSVAMTTKRPEYNDKLKGMVFLGPPVYCTKYQFMLNKESSIYNMMTDSFAQMKEKEKYEGFPRADVKKSEHQASCPDFPEVVSPYCTMGMDMSKKVVGEYVPAGSSMKTFRHFAQSYTSGKIREYDFEDTEANKKAYNQEEPPEYDIKKIKAPVSIFYATGDQAVDPGDVETLAGELPNLKMKFLMPLESFSHFDFVVKMNEEVEEDFNLLVTKVKDLVKA